MVAGEGTRLPRGRACGHHPGRQGACQDLV